MSNEQPSLAALEKRDDFVRRHIGPGEPQTAAMLESLGLASLDELIDKAVPAAIRSATPMALPRVRNERDTLAYLRRMADRNQIMTSMIGMGYYGTFLPGVIQRRVLENPGWYTAYTPYPAAVSQGRLAVLLDRKSVASGKRVSVRVYYV